MPMLNRTRSWRLQKKAKGLSIGVFVFSGIFSLVSPAAQAQGAPILEVRAAKQGGLLPENLADKIRSIEGVKGVEKYILKQADPHPVIGMEPGAPLRVLEGGKLLPADKGAGRWLRPGDRYAAMVGNVYKEDYTGSSGMSGMGGMMAMMRHVQGCVRSTARSTRHRVATGSVTARRVAVAARQTVEPKRVARETVARARVKPRAIV